LSEKQGAAMEVIHDLRLLRGPLSARRPTNPAAAHFPNRNLTFSRPCAWRFRLPPSAQEELRYSSSSSCSSFWNEKYGKY